MREIKFRAWHKEKKIMGEVLGIDILHKEIFFQMKMLIVMNIQILKILNLCNILG